MLGVGLGCESTFYVRGRPNLIEGGPHNGFIYLLAGGGTATWFIFILHAVVEPVLTYPGMILTIWVLMVFPALVPPRG